MKTTRLIALTIALLFGNAAFAACEFDIEAGDALQFSTASMQVDASCETVTVTLTHTGTLPAAGMGHNWALARDADYEAVATAGMSAGLEGNYLPADDDRLIAATRIIGGGESTSISFALAKLDPAETYTFFCSFPGHWSIMKGSFKIV
ncbi:MAG: azurin [Pseudomonadota bacterium]